VAVSEAPGVGEGDSLQVYGIEFRECGILAEGDPADQSDLGITPQHDSA
jgi:hypothetical protein